MTYVRRKLCITLSHKRYWLHLPILTAVSVTWPLCSILFIYFFFNGRTIDLPSSSSTSSSHAQIFINKRCHKCCFIFVIIYRLAEFSLRSQLCTLQSSISNFLIYHDCAFVDICRRKRVITSKNVGHVYSALTSLHYMLKTLPTQQPLWKINKANKTFWRQNSVNRHQSTGVPTVNSHIWYSETI